MPLYTAEVEYFAKHFGFAAVDAEDESEARRKILNEPEHVGAAHREQLTRFNGFTGEILEGSIEIFSVEEE